jgi:hypothetical protein
MYFQIAGGGRIFKDDHQYITSQMTNIFVSSALGRSSKDTSYFYKKIFA